MPYDDDQVLVVLQKRKVGEGISRSPQRQRQKQRVEKAFPSWVLMVDLDALRTFGLAAR